MSKKQEASVATKSTRGAKPVKPAEPTGPEIDGEFIEQHNQQLQAMSAVQAELHDAAMVTAREIGYEGDISIGSLEDGIRFYQRRTAEACLELGKRLILLKELTPHGEFEERAELLGFTKSTAHRFMQVAAKVAKSANLGLLAGRAKNVSALLELVTHDDEELETLKNLDDIERMSPSQLRAALRKQRESADSVNADLQQRDAEIGELKKKVSAAQREWTRMSPDEQAQKLQQQVNIASVSVRAAIGARGGDYGLGNAVRNLCEHAVQHDIEVGNYLGGIFREIETLLHVLRDDPELGLSIPIFTAQVG